MGVKAVARVFQLAQFAASLPADAVVAFVALLPPVVLGKGWGRAEGKTGCENQAACDAGHGSSVSESRTWGPHRQFNSGRGCCLEHRRLCVRRQWAHIRL